MNATEGKKIAVLIDGDNADAQLIDQILNEASRFGRITVKRIYADFTTQQMNGWKNRLNEFAIRPVQKFAYTKGKNSTDSALIIDAMDIMHAKLVDGFCIVSSDSDYTGIAHRIREEGMFIMGIGKSHTPEAFVKACDNFTYTEILATPEENEIPAEKKSAGAKRRSKKAPATEKVPETKTEPKAKPELKNLVTGKSMNINIMDKAFEMVYDDLTGLALASRLGDSLKKVDPTFDIRSYGYRSFRKFLEALGPKFEIVIHPDGQTISVKRNKRR